MHNPNGKLFGLLSTVNECISQIERPHVGSDAPDDEELYYLANQLADAIDYMSEIPTKAYSHAWVAKMSALRSYFRETQLDRNGNLPASAGPGEFLMWSVLCDMFGPANREASR